MNKIRRGISLALGLVFAGMTIAGCGVTSRIDETAVVATIGDEEILLKEANFWAKYQEALTNTSYKYYYNILVSNGYSETESANMAQNYSGTLDEITDKVMESLETFYVMKAHAEEYGITITEEDEAKIEAAAEKFLKDNSRTVETIMTADKEIVSDVLRIYTIYMRLIPFMETEGLNTEISEDEALMKTFSYVYVSFDDSVNEDGETVSYTETQKVQEANALQEFVDSFRASGETDFDAAVEEAGYSVSEHSYSPSDEEDTLKDLNSVAEGMQVGDVSDIIELTDEDGVLTGVAVLRFDTDKDLEAIEEKKTSILSERKSECFNALLEKWKSEADFTVNEEVLKTITTDDNLVQKTGE